MWEVLTTITTSIITTTTATTKLDLFLDKRHGLENVDYGNVLKSCGKVT